MNYPEKAPARPRRSALFLPASNPRAISKARTLPCDVVVLDLEDAVAPEAKADAREAAAAAVAQGFGPRETVVRVNALDTPHAAEDLGAIAAARPDAILLPKVDGADTLHRARALAGEVPLWAMVETARGLLDVARMAQVSAATGLVLLVAGTNDLAAELRCRPGPARAPLLPALAQIVWAARAHGLGVLDGVHNAIDDASAVEAECRQGRDLGFDGKTLIHPSQIAPANRAFAPDAAEVAWAQRIVDAFADPAAAARGAIRVDGAMIELLHLHDARRVLALAEACARAG